jgi:hypothetical protein
MCRSPVHRAARRGVDRRFVVVACVLTLLLAPTAACAQAAAAMYQGPYLSLWSPTTRDTSYLYAGWLQRSSDDGAPDHTVLSVGAQFGVANAAGVHQIAFGVAAEAWSMPGSLSMLTGIEASTINLEPNNAYRKISLWSTFKNRSDAEYWTPPAQSMNVDSQALRIESQPGTGFERGIVFGKYSLFPSPRLARPAVIDLTEIPDAQIGNIDLIRIREGVSLRYDPKAGELYLYKGQ